MGYNIRKVELLYEFGKLLPDNDSTYITYKEFRKDFGQDGLVLVIASNSKDLYKRENFEKWHELGNRIDDIQVPLIVGKNKGDLVYPIDSVFSEAHLYNIIKNTEQKKFELKPIFKEFPKTQQEVDSIRDIVYSLPFYKNMIYKDSSNLHMMMVFMNEEIFNSKSRGSLVQDIKALGDSYKPYLGELKYSGLPYIRSVSMTKVQSELSFFVLLALLVTSLLLYVFFRSMKVVIVSLIVVFIGVIWSWGSIGLIGFKVTALMGLIPPLMIVIGIPNCIYLINKYQQEIKEHGNKAKALTRVIRKVGNATFMTNATTAMGFGTFIFTHSDMMKEFGIIAATNIMAMFFLSILIVPIIYSYLKAPKEKHVRHLDKKWLYAVVDKLVLMTTRYRKMVYLVSIAVIGIGITGLLLMKTTGNIVDDLPKHDQVVKDLKFFEGELNGVLPFEIIFTSNDTVFNDTRLLQKIDEVQKVLKTENKLSKSLSIVDAVKYLNQAYKNGRENHYRLDIKTLGEINDKGYFGNTFRFGKENADSSSKFVNGFLDSTYRKTRVTVQIADIGTDSMEALLERVTEKIDGVVYAERNIANNAFRQSDARVRDTMLKELYGFAWVYDGIEDKLIEKGADEFGFFEANYIYQFHDEPYFKELVEDVVNKGDLKYGVTGTGVTYTKGTTYLVNNLFISLAIAIMVIAGLMSVLFRSWRMVLVSLFPNLLPLIVTSGIMGFTGIPIKPSTILVFSIAFGISVDDTIHFLAKYRQELKANGWDIRKAVINALRETGVSMIYTSIILFFGFMVFAMSDFGGTQALGILVSVTLFVAMLANLVLLPSLLLSLEKLLTTKAFSDPPLLEWEEDDEQDIEIEELELKN